MKKLFFGLTFLIITIVIGTYWILFSATGNSFVATLIEQKVNQGQKQVNLKVNDFKLTTSEVLFNATIDDNSIVNIEGGFDIFAKNVDLTYDINIKDLSKLQNITKQKLNGSFSTKGTIKGDKVLTKVQGISAFASSDTKYDVSLVEFKPSKVLFYIKNAKLDELLHIVDKPRYASGYISIHGNIKNAMIDNLDGKIVTKLSQGLVDNSLVNRDFNQKLQSPLVFKGEVVTNLEKTKAKSMASIETSMANLDIKEAVFDINKSSLNSDYLITVSDLSKLYDVTQTKMRGKLSINGNLRQDKNGLYVDGNSELFGGKLDFNLLNNDFRANIKDIEVVDLMHMLYYPEVFTSSTNIKVDYNILNKIGVINGELVKGQFLENEFSKVINTFARFDITKEIYEKVTIDSKIEKNIINTLIDMESKYTKIVVPASTLDTKEQTINALVQTTIKDYSFDTTVKGDIKNPKVKVDTTKFIKEKAKKKIEDKLKEKLGDKIKLDKLFNKAPSKKTKTKVVKKQDSKLDLTPNAEATNEEIAAAFKKFFQE